MYIDTHAHLTDGAFDDDRQELIKGLAAGGIGKIIEISCDPKDFPVSAALAEKNPGIYLAFGIHPEFAESCTESDIAALEKYLRHPKCVALGEIGLDYYWKPYNREKQLELFRRQLDMAIERDMPVSMHIREAYGDCMEVLESYGGRIKGVMHCFSGSVEMARELLRRGWYLGFDGPITYKNAVKALDVIAACPTDRMLLETDSPYLSPVPNRGKRNDSRNLPYIAARIAEIKGMTTEEVAEVTLQNGKQLFGL